MEDNSIWSNLLWIIVGSLLEAFFKFEDRFKDVKNWFVEKQRQKQIRIRKKLFDGGLLYDWLVEYYIRRGSASDLYNCKINNFEIKIPFLLKKEWCDINIDLLKKHDLILLLENFPNPFPTDNKAINRRKKFGQKLFNEPTVYLNRIEQTDNKLQIVTNVCHYFEMLSFLIKIEEESFTAALSKKFTKTSIRDKLYPDVHTPANVFGNPVSVGGQVTILLKSETNYEVIIQTRSATTITFGNSKAVVPSFGFSPVEGRRIKDTDLIYFNFIKEYLEELYNYEEIVELYKNKKNDPTWFFKLNQAVELNELIKNGNFLFRCTGFGFDALNGSFNLALLVVVDELAISNKIKRDIVSNWEIIERNDDITNPIDFIDINSNEITEFAKSKCFHFSGLFSLVRGIEVFKKMKGLR